MRDLIQFRVSKHDELLATIIEELEKDGEEKKGYVGNQLRQMIKSFYQLGKLVDEDPLKNISRVEEKLKERIRAFEVLADLAGEEDPYRIILKLSKKEASSPSPRRQTKKVINAKQWKF